MDLALTDEQRIIVDMVRRFVREEIVPLEDTLDPDADEVPPEKLEELVEKTKEMGLHGLDTPPGTADPISISSTLLDRHRMQPASRRPLCPCYYAFGGARQAQLFEATDARE